MGRHRCACRAGIIQSETTDGLKLCPKLNREHIILAKFQSEGLSSCTGILVKLLLSIIIFKVMSETVASALQYLDEERTRETCRFIRMIDQFFDALRPQCQKSIRGENEEETISFPIH